jgi:hypothetical protein
VRASGAAAELELGYEIVGPKEELGGLCGCSVQGQQRGAEAVELQGRATSCMGGRREGHQLAAEAPATEEVQRRRSICSGGSCANN